MSETVLDSYQELVAQSEKVYEELVAGSLIRIQVGSATCENAAGAQDVHEAFHRHITASGREDIMLTTTGCTGRCSREPIVSILEAGKIPVKYEKVDADLVYKIFTEHILGGKVLVENTLSKRPAERKHQIMVCDGSPQERTQPGGAHTWFEECLQAKKDAGEIEPEAARVFSGNSMGFCTTCEEDDMVRVFIRPDKVLYDVSSKEDVEKIVTQHIIGGAIVEDLKTEDSAISPGFFKLYGDVAFFRRQSRIVLRNAGLINPESCDDYLRCGGFNALTKVLKKDDPDWVVQEVLDAKLRGRGGGGFLTGMKWGFARKSAELERYIICNADEGDPGAFMDRSMLESDPYGIIEGMIIGGFAIGAQHGFFYVRAEYPLAIERIEKALDECRKRGLLGKNILGSGWDFDLEIRLGAGAFVCGEETALIHSIEGERGQPSIRPPFPTDAGLWGKPTVINNVETFGNIPAVIQYGAEWFSQAGSEQSGGTKVFALAGKVNHTGLIEVPMGTTLKDIVFGIGGGVEGGKELKAIQTGGPAGGLIPVESIDTPVDFHTLGKLGSIMGSGGMIVLDEDDCMVDVAKFFMTFCQDESCGKCTPCREGTKRMLEILERMTTGKGKEGDIDKLERLAALVKKSSLCGLGRAAPNPILSSIKHFREEYEAHVNEKRCPAAKCTALIRYEIDDVKCVGCTMCARKCPAACITGERKEVHFIEQDACIKCGQCFESCRFEAIKKL